VTLIVSKNGEIIDEFDLVDVVGVFNYLKDKLVNQNFDKKLARTLIKDCTFAIKKLEKGTVKGIEKVLTLFQWPIEEFFIDEALVDFKVVVKKTTKVLNYLKNDKELVCNVEFEEMRF
jgi:hypothetical protein